MLEIHFLIFSGCPKKLNRLVARCCLTESTDDWRFYEVFPLLSVSAARRNAYPAILAVGLLSRQHGTTAFTTLSQAGGADYAAA
jgi:hypothetical protein